MDTFEAERKYRCDHETLREVLVDAGFTHEGTIEQVDRYVDHPTRSFAVTDEALRIRTVTTDTLDAERTELTYKGPQVGETAKTRAERTVILDSASMLQGILTAVDFEVVGSVHKQRERFVRDDTVVTLDMVDGLGEFAEIEVQTDASGIEQAEEELAQIADELGLSDAMLVEETYLGLLLKNSSE